MKPNACKQIAKGGPLELTSRTLVSVLSLCPDLAQSELPSPQSHHIFCTGMDYTF